MKTRVISLILAVSPLICPLLFSYGSGPKKETASTPQYIKDYNAGVEAQKNKNYMDAINFYQSAVDQKSDFSDAWNNLGYCYRMVATSYLAKTSYAYDKALNYSPDHEEALEYQGEYFIMVGRLKDAYQNYQKLQQMNSPEAKELKEKLDAALKQAQSVLKSYSP